MTKGERIRKLRESIGLSQVDFADRIGVSKQTLYKYEMNIVTNIPSDKIEAIAKATGSTPAAIMGWEEKPDYYIDREARELAEFLHRSPEYRVLFDASRKVKPEDIAFVKQMIDRMANND